MATIGAGGRLLRAVTLLAAVGACSDRASGGDKSAASVGGAAADSGGSGASGRGSGGLAGAMGGAGGASRDGASGNGGVDATGGAEPRGGAGMAAAGFSGSATAGLGGAVSGGGSTTGGQGGLSGAGAGGAPIDLGPPGSDGFAIKVELASDIKPTAPTTVGIVEWSLDQPSISEAHIEFGLDTSYGMTAPVELDNAAYRTVLVGMKPQKTYHFRIVAQGTEPFTSDDHTLTTGAPFGTPLLGTFVVNIPEELDRGFFVTSFWMPSGDDASLWTAVILDSDGDVVWWYTLTDPPSGGERGFARARLSANSHDMWLAQVSNGGGPLRRVSIDGLEEQTYKETLASHDIAAVSGDTMAYLDYGEGDCASIFELDKTGKPHEVFESTGVTGDGTSSGSCHGNSVRYSKKADVYVFSDDFHDVVVVGRDGSVTWRLADKVAGGQASWGGYQHGTHLTDESLLIFANRGGGASGESEAIEFGLDGSVIRKFASAGGWDFLGDVQRLPSGNTLIDYGTLVQVVDPSDRVVLEMKGIETAFAYLEFRQSLYGEPLDIRE